MYPTRRAFLKYAQYDERLLELERAVKAHAKAYPENEYYCADEHWYGWNGFKSQMCRIVGWESETKELCNHNAYDTVYRYLYNLLTR